MISETALDLQAVQGDSAGSGVAGGDAIARFVEAVLADDRSSIATTREALEAELGADAVVDVAAVVTMFTVMNRVADATGTPVDEATRQFIEPIAGMLGMEPQD